MRVLLRDANDGTLIVVNAMEMGYDPATRELWISLPNEDNFIIGNMDSSAATEISLKLYQEGMVSLTDYAARFEEEGFED